ncbi:MAG: hypothetical protein F6K47_18380 [Symploca sp. SIO2E6]|nr:hypothetical protein [Symploca sp. SIO2E6]
MAIFGKHQHIYGGVAPNGLVMFGDGFTSHKIKEGTYIIEFEHHFGLLPAPVCTINGPEWKTFNLSITVVDVAPYHFVCVTSSPDRPVNCAFTFIVFGDT